MDKTDIVYTVNLYSSNDVSSPFSERSILVLCHDAELPVHGTLGKRKRPCDWTMQKGTHFAIRGHSTSFDSSPLSLFFLGTRFAHGFLLSTFSHHICAKTSNRRVVTGGEYVQLGRKQHHQLQKVHYRSITRFCVLSSLAKLQAARLGSISMLFLLRCDKTRAQREKTLCRQSWCWSPVTIATASAASIIAEHSWLCFVFFHVFAPV